MYFTTTVETMANVWMGKCSYRTAIAAKELVLVGQQALIKDVGAWLESSIFSDIAPATEI